jgi:hypothetical protein
VDQRKDTVKEVLEAKDRHLAILILVLRSRAIRALRCREE